MKKPSREDLQRFLSVLLANTKSLSSKNNSYPKISIVTISYNQASFLEKAILSVLNQGYPNLEYRILDGGSTDGTVDVIRKYQRHVDFWTSENDGGPASALNRGFSESSGQIFGYLNSDDFLLPGTLINVMRVFQENPLADVIYGHGFFADKDDRLTGPIYSDNWDLKRYAFGASNVTQQSTFFKPEAFRRAGGFNRSNHTCWDGEVLVDMALAGASFHRVDEVFGAFRLHSDSITGSGRFYKAFQEDTERIFEKIMKRRPSKFDRALMFPVWRLVKHAERLPYRLALRSTSSDLSELISINH